jgi:hypothetical protein
MCRVSEHEKHDASWSFATNLEEELLLEELDEEDEEELDELEEDELDDDDLRIITRQNWAHASKILLCVSRKLTHDELLLEELDEEDDEELDELEDDELDDDDLSIITCQNRAHPRKNTVVCFEEADSR